MVATLTTLINFNSANGAKPTDSLIVDSQGNLLGTTQLGGASGFGTVFEIAKTSTGYASTSTILVSFNGTDAAFPVAGLVADSAGNLFGTTITIGPGNEGTVFEILKTSTGYASTPNVLVTFSGLDGGNPLSGLVADASGNLFGTTIVRGAQASLAGTVYEIVKTNTGYATTPTTLASYHQSNGFGPWGGLLIDATGNLFGTTEEFTANGVGTVFEIVRTSTGYASNQTVLAYFNGANGITPRAPLIADAAGNLFGTTSSGGANNAGTVFELARTSTGYSNTPITLVSFSGASGGGPFGGLIIDAAGNLFGMTNQGGANNDGTVFEIAKTSTGYSNTPLTLATFNGANGALPYASLVADRAGNLFGTTSAGGTANSGTVFEITGSGFVLPATVSIAVDTTCVTRAHNTAIVTFSFSAAPVTFTLANTLVTGGVLSQLTLVDATHYRATFTALANTVLAAATVSVTGGSWSGPGGQSGAGAVSAAFGVNTATSLTFSTLYDIPGTISPNPVVGGVFVDPATGTIFGTTQKGGAGGQGSIFQIQNGAGTAQIISTFGSGVVPTGGLVQDANGNLFGTTYSGSPGAGGSVFELVRSGTGTYSRVTLTSISGTAGGGAYGNLLLDQTGNLFFTTELGGANNDGAVYELLKTNTGYAPAAVQIASFNYDNGFQPIGGLVADAAGNLYGTTFYGGASGSGSVFEIVRTGGGFASTPVVIASFNGSNGANPTGGVVFDQQGNIFGTTELGGAFGNGALFEIAKTPGGFGGLTVIGSFNGANGINPTGHLAIDQGGNVFGTTRYGGAFGYGEIFEFQKTIGGYSGTPVILHSFNVSDGAYATSGLTVDSCGVLYGTVDGGGALGGGTVFKVIGTDFITACYAAGTRIETDQGPVAVEHLRVGQRAVTHDGRTAPIQWVGHRRIDLTRHAERSLVQPIRIHAHAIAEGQPRHDLLVSPDHALFINGMLIPARLLVNGASIEVAAEVQSVVYYHVELDRHDILLAEGLPAESYLDTGNRAMFENAGFQHHLHPDFAGQQAARETLSCAPFAASPSLVEPVWRAIADRAQRLGWVMPDRKLTSDPELCLMAGTRRLRPLTVRDGIHTFLVPSGGEPVRLVSRAARPNEGRPWIEDRRCLGVMVRRIRQRIGTDLQDLALDDPALADGWWAVEWDAAPWPSRWTNGDALLPVSGPCLLEVELAGSMQYPLEHQREPARRAAAVA